LHLLPGSLCDRNLWRRQIEALESQVDIALGDLTRDDGVAAMASRILASAQGSFAVAGLSMKPMWRWSWARQAPHRVRKLALSGADLEALENCGHLSPLE
jgi:hypothetical protein